MQLSDRIRDFVDHVIPGEGFIHFQDVCAELAQAGYDRPLLLEVSTTHSVIKTPREFLRIAHRQACSSRLRSIIVKNRASWSGSQLQGRLR